MLHRIPLSLMMLTFAIVFKAPLTLAGTVYFDAQSNISAIKGLMIQDQTYDVHFRESTFADLFGHPTSFIRQPTFWQSWVGATEAQSAIDQVLITYYPAVLTNYYTNYLIPQKNANSSLEFVDDSEDTYTFPNYFRAVWGSYNGYYANRKWEEFLTAVAESGGICACIRQDSPNLEALFGTEINATRLFADFTLVETVPISNDLELQSTPESNPLIGLISLGVLSLSLIFKPLNNPIHLNSTN